MSNTIVCKTLFFIFLFFSLNICLAQDSLANKKNADESKDKFPKAVLIQLRTEQNRMEPLKKAHRNKDLKELEKDALGERSTMILDFTENFKYCPVYYFMDTNLDLVKKGIFDGILLNADGTLAKNAVTDDYVIAYYGYLTSRYKKGQNTRDSLIRITDEEVPMGRGLVITDKKYNVLTYFYKEDYDDIFFLTRKKRKKFIYISKQFDIEYYPFVGLFNLKLTDKAHIPMPELYRWYMSNDH